MAVMMAHIVSVDATPTVEVHDEEVVISYTSNGSVHMNKAEAQRLHRALGEALGWQHVDWDAPKTVRPDSTPKLIIDDPMCTCGHPKSEHMPTSFGTLDCLVEGSSYEGWYADNCIKFTPKES